MTQSWVCRPYNALFLRVIKRNRFQACPSLARNRARQGFSTSPSCVFSLPASPMIGHTQGCSVSRSAPPVGSRLKRRELRDIKFDAEDFGRPRRHHFKKI